LRAGSPAGPLSLVAAPALLVWGFPVFGAFSFGGKFKGPIRVERHETMSLGVLERRLEKGCQRRDVSETVSHHMKLEDRNRKRGEILLVADVLIDRDDHLKAVVRRRRQELAVLQVSPSKVAGMSHLVADKQALDSDVEAVVREEPSQPPEPLEKPASGQVNDGHGVLP
jgi:hypothetical protein